LALANGNGMNLFMLPFGALSQFNGCIVIHIENNENPKNSTPNSSFPQRICFWAYSAYAAVCLLVEQN
jgi:hypothetical protein